MDLLLHALDLMVKASIQLVLLSYHCVFELDKLELQILL